MDILLVAGLWLDGSAWDDVVPELAALGHRPVPLTLPGQGDGAVGATLDDQVAAVVAAVDAAAGKPFVVGHSAAASLAWAAADARPGRIAGVAVIGGFPASDGRPYAPSSRSGTGSWTSPAGSPSRARTPPTWTRPPGPAWPPPRSRSPVRSPRGSCGSPTRAASHCR
ncbi:alpha/beta fold hydrolase [Streptomyces sp. SBR177]